MKTREHAYLMHLQKSKVKPKKPVEIVDICVTCKGLCKSVKGLVSCPVKGKWN